MCPIQISNKLSAEAFKIVDVAEHVLQFMAQQCTVR